MLPVFWNTDLYGNPPGSKSLTCPTCLKAKNWYFESFTPEEDEEVLQWRLQAAYRIRAALQRIEFYAKKARMEREGSGSEMPYWIGMQGSQMCLERRPPSPDSVAGLTPHDLPDTIPVSWFSSVERIMLRRRQSAITAYEPRES